MKIMSKFLIGVLFTGLLSSCADKKHTMYDNMCSGVYNGAYQMQDMRNREPVLPAGEERPTYEQYKKEREAMLKDRNRLPSQ